MSLDAIVQQFIDWTKKKIRHHLDEEKRELYFREKEIWWAALGKNIGYEMDGKHEFFARPVIILKKFSANMCFVLPLTSTIKNGHISYQFIMTWDGKLSAVNLSQGRTISSKRLLDKMGTVENYVFASLLTSFINYFAK